jgi:hypothetical protein
VIGDPASTSALGGALRTQAITLAETLTDLDQAAQRAQRMNRPDPTQRERHLIERTARELDAVGAALQALSVTLVDGGARTRALEVDARRNDLTIDGTTVTDLPGPSRHDPAERLRAREQLQELLNRVTAAQVKDLARIAREVERSAPVLAAVSEQARSGS